MSINLSLEGIDTTLADQEWLRLWKRVRHVFNAVVRAPIEERAPGKQDIRRLLEEMRQVREGKTELGACTDYTDWGNVESLRRLATEQRETVRGIFAAMASDTISGPEHYYLWQSARNHQPPLTPDMRPEGYALH